MHPDRGARRLVAVLAGVSAAGLVLAACAGPRPVTGSDTSAPSSSLPSSVPPTAAPSTVPPASTTPSTARPSLTSSTVQVQIYSSAIVLTIGTHQSDLAGAVQDARFVSSDEFDFLVAGLALSSSTGDRTSSSSGAVSEVDLSDTGSGTAFRVVFRSPVSKDQVAVGGGTTVQITFS